MKYPRRGAPNGHPLFSGDASVPHPSSHEVMKNPRRVAPNGHLLSPRELTESNE